MPMMDDAGASRPPDAWLRRDQSRGPLVIAHRGGTGPHRENTVAAFRHARASGADGVELDVRRAADGTLSIVHDASLPSLGDVHALRRDELPDWLPTLADALAACAGLVVNVEIKNNPGDPGHDPAEAVVAAVVAEASASGAPAGLLISSFSPSTVRAALEATATARAQIPAALLIHPAFDPAAAVDAAARLGGHAVNPHHSQITPVLVDHAHDLGLAVHTWTVNDPIDVASVEHAGVDAIITDDPVGVRRILDGR